MTIQDLVSSTSHPPLRGRFIRVGSRRVHYHSRGRGRPVLLLHGNGSLGEEILSCFRTVDGVTWIAPDRPGYGMSEPLPKGREDPISMAEWALSFLDALRIRRVTVAAHSIAAGAALCLAAKAPERVGKLVLLAPFCRPTPQRWMLGLRLAVAPGIGIPLRRWLVPAMLPLFRERILEGMLAPNPVPPWLAQFPIEHAACGPSIRMMAAELRRFNEGMLRADPTLRVKVPVTAIFGEADETAVPSWHEPWLRRRTAALRVVRLPNTGHAVHHADPLAALNAIRG